MSSTTVCPLCHGRKIILEPDPSIPARVCSCVLKQKDGFPGLDIPERYRNTSLKDFLSWWRHREWKLSTMGLLEEARKIFEKSPDSIPSTLRAEWEKATLDTNLALLPRGWKSLQEWAEKGRPDDWWWIFGEPFSGKSSLLAAILKTWTQKTGKGGRFVSVRELAHTLRDSYNLKSFRHPETRSERDILSELMDQPILGLDSMDRLEGQDMRVAQALASLLDHRFDRRLPTLITANLPPERLKTRDGFLLNRLEDDSLQARLERASRVELRRNLERLMASSE